MSKVSVILYEDNKNYIIKSHKSDEGVSAKY